MKDGPAVAEGVAGGERRAALEDETGAAAVEPEAGVAEIALRSTAGAVAVLPAEIAAD